MNLSPRRDKHGIDLISDALPFEHRCRSHHAVIRVYDKSGNLIQTHEHTGDFKAW
jgi:hypothetical protein